MRGLFADLSCNYLRCWHNHRAWFLLYAAINVLIPVSQHCCALNLIVLLESCQHLFWSSVEISIDDDDWNDGLLATIREKVFNVNQQPNFLIFMSHSVNYEFLLSLLNLVDQVHMEADRKAMSNQVNVPADLPLQSKTTYRIRNKVTCSPEH
jgi:hypothetical protein